MLEFRLVPDGGSHQALEDIALMRVLPRMTVISPCDAIEARKATIAAAEMNGPVYIRLARDKTPVMTVEETPFEIGRAQIFYESQRKPQAAIIATGALLHKALLAARQLESEGIAVKVLNLSTIKPLDEDSVLKLAKEAGAIVTVEEHQIYGGMGSAISEYLVRNYPTPIEFVGVDDKFGQSGKPEELIEYYGMGANSIARAVRKAIKRK